MFAYNHHFNAGLSILLYPKTSQENGNIVSYENFQNHHTQVAFVDIFDEKGKLNKKLGITLYEELVVKGVERLRSN